MLCLQDKFFSVIVHAEPEDTCDIVVISKQDTKIPRSISSCTDLPNLKVLNQVSEKVLWGTIMPQHSLVRVWLLD